MSCPGRVTSRQRAGFAASNVFVHGRVASRLLRNLGDSGSGRAIIPCPSGQWAQQRRISAANEMRDPPTKMPVCRGTDTGTRVFRTRFEIELWLVRGLPRRRVEVTSGTGVYNVGRAERAQAIARPDSSKTGGKSELGRARWSLTATRV